MFERFTERNRQVVVLAQDAARKLKHNYIGTEHLLLGLLREEEGLGARVLVSMDITAEEVEQQVKRIVGEGDEATSGQIPFTPRAKKVLELALREALSLGHNYIGTEHTLLGLVRENEGVAARILLDFDADADKIRNEVIRMLNLGKKVEGEGEASFSTRAARAWNKVPQDVGATIKVSKENSENEMASATSDSGNQMGSSTEDSQKQMASSTADMQIVVEHLKAIHYTLEQMRIETLERRCRCQAKKSEGETKSDEA